MPDLFYAPELRYLADIDEQLEATIRSSSITVQARLIASGAGCGILPCFIPDVMPGLVRMLDKTVSIERSFLLVGHRDMRHLARVLRVIDWLRSEITKGQPILRGDSTLQAEH